MDPILQDVDNVVLGRLHYHLADPFPCELRLVGIEEQQACMVSQQCSLGYCA